ncbi:TPA: hypothetical protein MAO48_001076 [Klebsiella pneumoniae]|nr:hypothetical protein [Klebsiella pneumoniae]
MTQHNFENDNKYHERSVQAQHPVLNVMVHLDPCDEHGVDESGLIHPVA